MSTIDTACMWIADIVPFLSTLIAFIYGVKKFFKKGAAFYLQIVTMSMGCYAMGSLYHLCQTLTSDVITEGFTAAYLGRIGFFLFLFTANFGQIDNVLDDGSAQVKKSRIIAVIAPLLAGLLFIPNAITDMPVSTKITHALVWIAAIFSLYFNFKHAIISDMDIGFAKAIRPYNISAVILTFLELIILTMWSNYDIENAFIIIAALATAFGVMSIVTIVNLKKGVEKWKT